MTATTASAPPALLGEMFRSLLIALRRDGGPFADIEVIVKPMPETNKSLFSCTVFVNNRAQNRNVSVGLGYLETRKEGDAGLYPTGSFLQFIAAPDGAEKPFAKSASGAANRLRNMLAENVFFPAMELGAGARVH